ncbi:MAG: aspartate kinase [Clostridia bacterium]|nr:aspartate kinase [Clostridia bacterium]MBR4954943.1 aspartate kinase [Clostridia bacterium]
MEITVMKFGGTSVANSDRMTAAAQKIAKEARRGRGVVAVVSAQGKLTDELIAKAKELNTEPTLREMDALLSAGEQISSSLLAMAVAAQGVPSVAMSGWQAGFVTTGSFGSARIKKLETERVTAALAEGKTVIVAGFQGICDGDITTLGRGGSDTSAVALAAALGADICRIYTDVDGVYTADPRVVKTAKKLDGITYDEMFEMASLGAGVMHNRSIKLAKKYNVPLEVRSSFSDLEGTIIKERYPLEEKMIRGTACDEKTAKISLVGVSNIPGIASKLFSTLKDNNIHTDMIIQSLGADNSWNITFTIPVDNAERALYIAHSLRNEVGATRIDCDKDIAKVSLIGTGLMENPEIPAKMFAALTSAGVNIQMISSSEIRLSVVVAEADAKKALSAVHEAFFGV